MANSSSDESVEEETGKMPLNNDRPQPGNRKRVGRPVGTVPKTYSPDEISVAFDTLLEVCPRNASGGTFLEQLQRKMKEKSGITRTTVALQTFVKGKLRNQLPELYRRKFGADRKEPTEREYLYLCEFMKGTAWQPPRPFAKDKNLRPPAMKVSNEAAAEIGTNETERGKTPTNEEGKRQGGLPGLLSNPLHEGFNFNPTFSSTPRSLTRQLPGESSKAGGFFGPQAKKVKLFHTNEAVATSEKNETELGDTPTNEGGKRKGSIPSLLCNPLNKQGESSKATGIFGPHLRKVEGSAPTTDQNLQAEQGDIPTNGERTAPDNVSVPLEHLTASSLPISYVVDTTVIKSIVDKVIKHRLKSFRGEVVDMVRSLMGTGIKVEQDENVLEIIDLTEDNEETHHEEVAALQVETRTDLPRTLEEDPSQPLGNGHHEHSKVTAEPGSHSSTQNVTRQRLLSDSYEQAMNLIADNEVLETRAAPPSSPLTRTMLVGSEAMTLDVNLSETLENDKEKEDGDKEQLQVKVASCIESDSRAQEFAASPLRARLSTITMVEVFEIEEDSNTLDPNPFRVIKESDGSFTIKHVSSVDAGQWSVGATVGQQERSTITEELSDVQRRDITEVCKDGPSLSPMKVKANKKVSFMKADIISGTNVVKALFKKLD